MPKVLKIKTLGNPILILVLISIPILVLTYINLVFKNQNTDFFLQI